MLPEACVANIISFTSPADIFSSSTVSFVFRLAGDSDFVWEKFLPSDYKSLISRSTDHHQSFSSKKEIYRCLCDSLLIDNARKQELSPYHRATKHPTGPGARFSESAELITTDRLEVSGKIQPGVLSPNTRYGAYLIIKVTKRAYGLDLVPAETWVQSRNGHIVKNTAYLCCLDEKKQQMKRLLYGNREERMAMTVKMVSKRREPKSRDDGWMEIELGNFETREGEDHEVNMSLSEVKGYQLKGGVVIDGIEVRPKSSN
ncbi:hypothetical protein Bca101_017513 [Brassica carinata]